MKWIAGVVFALCSQILVVYAADDWTRVNYTADACDIHGAFVTKTGAQICVGAYGTIQRLVDATTPMPVHGSQNEPDLFTGVAAWGDSLLVFGDKGTILLSTDDGIQWKSISLGINADVRACGFTSAHSVLLCSENGLLLIGADKVVKQVDDFSATHIMRLDGQRMVVGGETGEVLISTDAGDTWSILTTLSEPLAGFAVLHDKLYCLTRAAIYDNELSFTGTWRRRTSPSTNPGRAIAAQSDTLFVASANGPYVDLKMSADDGATWFGGSVSENGFPQFGILTLADGLFLYGERGFYHIAKIGALYDSARFSLYGIGKGRNAQGLRSWSSLSHVKDSIWVGTTRSPVNAVWMSRDNAVSWTLVLRDTTTFNSTEFNDVVSDGKAIGALATVMGVEVVDGELIYSSTFRLYMSADNGEAWTSVDARAKDHWAKHLMLTSDGKLFLYGGNQIYRTDISVVGIDTLDIRLPYFVSSLSMNTAGTLIAVGSEFAMSTDNGDSWQYSDVPSSGTGDKQCVLLDDGSHVVLAFGGTPGSYAVRSYRRNSLSGPWDSTVVLEPSPVLNGITGIATDRNGVIAASTAGGRVLLSADKGVTWTNEQIVPGTLYSLFDILIHRDGRVYCSGNADYIYSRPITVSAIEHMQSSVSQLRVTLSDNGSMLHIDTDQPLDDVSLYVCDMTGCIEPMVYEVASGSRSLSTSILHLTTGTYIIKLVGSNMTASALIHVVK